MGGRKTSLELGAGQRQKTSGKEPNCQCRRCKRCGSHPRVGKIPWRSTWQPTPVFLPGESPEQRSLADYSLAQSQTWLKQFSSSTSSKDEGTSSDGGNGNGQGGVARFRYKRRQRDFPVGAVVKNPPGNAGDVGLIPGQGTKIPHAAEQLGLHTTGPGDSRAHVPQLDRPRATARIQHAATKTRRSQINKGPRWFSPWSGN